MRTIQVTVLVVAGAVLMLILATPPQHHRYGRSAGADLAELGREVSVLAADRGDAPPEEDEPDPELGPEKMLQSTWPGLQTAFVHAPCMAYRPDARIHETFLDPLQYRRAIANVENIPQPLGLRQRTLQFLSLDWRPRRDRYTRAEASNDLAHGTCSKPLERRTEAH